MNGSPRMEWTCPDCRSRHSRSIPEGTADGALLAVACGACGAGYDATAVVRGEPGRRAVYGVPWIGSGRRTDSARTGS